MSSYIDTLDSARVSQICATLGILSTTIFFSMNTTINYLTMPTIFLGQPPRKGSQLASPDFMISSTGTPASPSSHLTRQWQELFWRGHRVGPTSAIFSAVTLGSAAYFSRSPVNGRLFAIAAGSALTAVPYTLLVMLPTNAELHRRGDAITEGVQEKKGIDEEDTTALIRKWVGMSKVRAGAAFVATVFGVIGLLW